MEKKTTAESKAAEKKTPTESVYEVSELAKYAEKVDVYKRQILDGALSEETIRLWMQDYSCLLYTSRCV